MKERQIHIVNRLSAVLSLFFIPLICSASQTSDSMIILQDTASATIDTSDYYPGDMDFNLIIASGKGYDEEVLRLLNLGANVNVHTMEGVTPLMYAVQNGHKKVVKILLLNGADPDAIPFNGPPALIVAVSNNDLEISELMIRKGADIDISDHDSRTSLMYATAYGYSQMADMLLYYDANVNAEDYNGITALMISSCYGFTDIARLLINHKSVLEKTDDNGFTSMHYAVQNNHQEIIELLLSQGADIDKKNNAGYSAISIAVNTNNVLLTRYLIQHGADVNSKISNAYKPLNLARKNKNDSIIQILSDNNARSGISPSIDYGSIHFDFSVNAHDFILGGGIGLHDSRYRLSMNLGYITRIVATEVLEGVDNNLYYQYWERRSYFFLGLTERLPVYSWEKDHWLGFGLGGQLLYTYGSYRGSAEKPDNKFILSPHVQFYARVKHVVFSFKYEYVNFKVEGLSPSRFTLGLHFLIPGRKIREPIYKEIIY
ncbi:MAG: ankyrin repeat domain-containing protein [Bacteroidales bacterium]|nr:ankyrin repeat domain-containing protein [Bacteroidales bacterium]